MKFLYHFRTQGAGAEGVHISGIATALEELGHRVVFSSPTGIDPRQSAGANPFGSGRKRGLLTRLAAKAPGFVFELMEIGYNFVAWLRNRALLEREKCDVIYERHAFFLCSTALLAASRGVPMIVEVNELAGDERVRSKPWLGFLARWADRITFRRARLIVVVSPHLKRRIEALGIDSAKILVLPNAVSRESLDAPRDPLAVRQRHGIEHAVVVGFVGWFVPWHRLDRLIAEFARLAPQHPNARLMLVGDGHLNEALAAQAASLGIEDRVIFTGAIPHREVGDYLAAMDIAVVPHSNEYRSPIKLFESMAAGGAVLAPRTEPIEMVIRDCSNGLLFSPEDATHLREQLSRLLADAELRKKLGTTARADVLQHHTWRQNAEAMLAAVREFAAVSPR